MQPKSASLIAFDKFVRFVLKKTQRASLIAFDKFERFVFKKLRAKSTIPNSQFLIPN